jgi:uncharacterized protein (TIGR03437 family)
LVHIRGEIGVNKPLCTIRAIPLAGCLLACSTIGLTQVQPPITEYPLPAGPSGTQHITPGPDGALWFTEAVNSKIGRITTAGLISEYSLPAGSTPLGITTGPDGAVWFVESSRNKIGRINFVGGILEYTISTPNSGPSDITAGPDGALWFTEFDGGKIGRVTIDGIISEYSKPDPDPYFSPWVITAGPDGALWFVDYEGQKIGRITTVGAISEYPVPVVTTNNYPYSIAVGPDGALWFTEELGNKIGRITTSGSITEYPIPTSSSRSIGIAAARDGALWFTEFDGNKLGRITTAGVITEYPLGTVSSGPAGITTAPDGTLWVTEERSNKIATRSPFFATIHVPGDRSTIQAAIDAASAGDDIEVAAGTYHERIDFKGKGIRLHSASGPEVTIIDGGRSGPVVTFANSETTSSILDGFTIQNGGGSTSGLDEGGGISIEGCSPTIQNNFIQDNKSGYAGGGIGIGSGSPVIQNNIIRRNTETGGIGGGGISTRGGNPIITGNTITDNTAAFFGGGLSFGAASHPVIRNNLILRNRGQDAGGISFVNGAVPLIQQNLIALNTGTGAGGISAVQGTLINNTIAENTGPAGSAVNGFYGTGLVVENNVFESSSGQTLINCSTGSFQPKNNVLFAPGGTLTSSACPDIVGTNGNINADPLFVCTSENFRLQPSSPAIDAGDSGVAVQSTDLDGSVRVVAGLTAGKASIDIGAYEFQGPSTLSISVMSLSFSDQIVGSTSNAQLVTISNIGTRRGSFCVVPPARDFKVGSNCGTGLDASASCSFQVTFNPQQAGSRTGTITIPSDSPSLPAGVTLSGVGLNPSPQLIAIAPTSAIVNAPAFTLQVTGSAFVPSSVVQWNGSNLATTFVSAGVLTAVVPTASLNSIGTTFVQVVSPDPGGGGTASLPFTILGPVVSPSGLVNGANYSPQVSAGSYAALFGTSLASSSVSARSLPLPTSLGSVSVLMNGYAAPLFFVSPTQINLQVPWELAGSTDVQVIVTTNGVSAAPISVALTPLAPGLMSTNSQGSGQGLILVAGTNQIASTTRPVNRTEAISIYCIGLGLVSNVPASGAAASLTGLASTVNTPSVTIGGIPGKVLFSGLAPALVGVYQVNVQLPLNGPAGPAVPVTLSIGNVESNTVTIAVQ